MIRTLSVLLLCASPMVSAMAQPDTAWVRYFDGGVMHHDDLFAMAVDDSDFVYVTGRIATDPPGYDIATVKYSSTGDLVWVRTFDGSSSWIDDDQGRDLAVDGFGHVLVTGMTSVDTIIGENTFSHYDLVVLKYDYDGSLVWERQFNQSGYSDDIAVAIEVDSAGYIYVCGQSRTDVISSDDYLTLTATCM